VRTWRLTAGVMAWPGKAPKQRNKIKTKNGDLLDTQDISHFVVLMVEPEVGKFTELPDRFTSKQYAG
jgi:hypothetical protein